MRRSGRRRSSPLGRCGTATKYGCWPGGGTLYFAFPLLYASAFSGFYLPLMIVLWLLVARGVSLELRNHLEMGVWRTLLDRLFGIASALLAIFYGAALANVIRGVPLQADGYFFLPLWTNWKPGMNPGILDWYTVIGGLVAIVALTLHGALWLTIKVSGDLEQRARRVVRPLWLVLIALTVVSLAATIGVRPETLQNYYHYPFTFVVPVGVIASLRGHLAVEPQGRAGEGIPGIVGVPVLYAGGRVLGALSHAAAVVGAKRVRHHAGEGDQRAAHACGRAGVVAVRDDACGWLRRVCLQPVPRQSGCKRALSRQTMSAR